MACGERGGRCGPTSARDWHRSEAWKGLVGIDLASSSRHVASAEIMASSHQLGNFDGPICHNYTITGLGGQRFTSIIGPALWQESPKKQNRPPCACRPLDTGRRESKPTAAKDREKEWDLAKSHPTWSGWGRGRKVRTVYLTDQPTHRRTT